MSAGEGQFGPREPLPPDVISPVYDVDVGATKGFVNHGDDATTPRPGGYASVEWFGTVEPENWIDGDTWVNPS